jgi:hypothetical protein
MQIKFLKAGSGDSILISHQTHHILIDGGNEPDYLLAQLTNIYASSQCIDLLVITHHDDDHINGILVFLERVVKREFGDHFIKEVIFNSPRAIHGTLPQINSQLLSYRQAYLAENLLEQINPTWEICNEDTRQKIFKDMTLHFLSPTQEDIDIYSNRPGAYLSSDFKCDWSVPIDDLVPFISDDSKDSGIANKTSVVIIAETPGRRVLLTGDVTPDRLLVILQKLCAKENKDRIKFDYVKLPHHGSYRSLTKSIIEKLDCHNFIISTNSSKYFLPNKRTLIKILLWLKRQDEDINFLFNYEEALLNLNVSPQEQKKYQIKLIKNNQSYGFGI